MQAFYSFFLAEHQNKFLMQEAKRLGLTPSEFLGRVLDQYMEWQRDAGEQAPNQESASSTSDANE